MQFRDFVSFTMIWILQCCLMGLVLVKNFTAVESSIPMRVLGSSNSFQIDEELTCDFIVKDFRANWYRGTRYLSKFLYDLKFLNCSQFEEQCSKQTYRFTEFTSLMYMKFCNKSELMTKSYDKVKSGLLEQSNNSQSWSKHFNKTTVTLRKTKISKPCLQLAKYDQNQESKLNPLFEIVDICVPFCSVIWSGINRNFSNQEKLSLWTIMPQS